MGIVSGKLEFKIWSRIDMTTELNIFGAEIEKIPVYIG